MIKSGLILTSLFLILISLSLIDALPAYFDWRDNSGNWMTSVKNQEHCGSCWAFASVGVTEAQYNIAKNQSDYDLDLSEEMLISNCSIAGDCNQGYIDSAFNYLKDTGVVNESCFPYVDANCYEGICGCTYGCSNAKCSDNQCNSQESKYKIDDYTSLNNNVTEIENWLVNHGPVSANIWWADYSWDNNLVRHCNPDSGGGPYWHSVVIVGYNETKKRGRQVLKNS